MRISSLCVDGFGVWTGLRVEGLADGVNLIGGPNEAGKTTLMQFVRSVLYGFSPERREYLPPLHGGRPGGWLEVAAPSGSFRLSRHAEGEASDASARLGKLLVEGTDGSRHGEQLLPVLLSNVDEAIYNNVFAVGLRELQELGLLSGTDAAAMLYNLSAGLDRVSIVEVMRELAASRGRIVSQGGQPCQMADLLAQRERLQAEIAELGRTTRHYARLTADRGQAEREAARLEEDLQRLQQEVRVLEAAESLRDRFAERASLDAQLAVLGPGAAMPEGALARLDALAARLQEHVDGAAELRAQRDACRREAKELKLNEMLWRQAARIEALREQEPWITALEEQVLQVGAEIAEIQPKLEAEQKRFGLDVADPSGVLGTLSARTMAGLRQPAGAIRLARNRLESAKRQEAAAEETALALTEQFEKALAARGEKDLPAAIDQTSDLMARLRRRVQVDERLEQMKRHRAELETQSHGLIGRQVMPAWVIVGLGAVFVLGVVLLMAGWFLPTSVTGSSGLPLSMLGIAGIAAGVLSKLYLDRSNSRQLEACQKQIGLLNLQVRQAKEERETLDQQLPRGGGSVRSRLEAAEKELAALEELTPLDSRRQTAQREAEAAAESVRQCGQQLVTARRRWRDSLSVLGLPEKLSPKQVRKLIESSERIHEMARRAAQRREELKQREKELEALTGRIAQLATEVGLDAAGLSPIDLLHRLAEELARHEVQLKRRRELRDQARALHRKQLKHESSAARLKERRRQLFREAGVADEDEYRRRAADCARAEALSGQRAALQREIDAALAGLCPEETVAAQLREPGDIASRRQELGARLDEVRIQLQERYEQRGRLGEQLRLLAEDRRLPAKRLELAAVEKRIADATRRWQVLALTSRMLESVRAAYERDRQPETLQEASGYLGRLTAGRYGRVWTPIDADVLRVDDAEGRTHPVERLSHGTREQLFLSLRLALVGTYARRGVHLPVILDDVLVNFDSDRARAAAIVLREFAEAGHQCLVFTCHEHIQALFKGLGAAVAALPDCAEREPPAVVLEAGAEKRPRPKRKPAAVVEEVAAPAAPEPPIEPDEEPVEPDDEPLEPELIDEDDFADEGPDEAFAEEEDEEEDFQWEEATSGEDDPDPVDDEDEFEEEEEEDEDSYDEAEDDASDLDEDEDPYEGENDQYEDDEPNGAEAA